MDAEPASLSVAAALARATAWLRQAPRAGASGVDSPALDAQLLLAHVLARPRSALLAHDQHLLRPEQAAAFDGLLARRARGEPVAYLTGRKAFWTLELRVTPDVLVPRPETELLVERCLALLPAPEASVADLGTGSGAVALALASERPRWQVTATDRSGAALAVAASNARALGLGNVRLLEGDWFAPLAGRRFDLIASNPPYIAGKDDALADPALRHEPAAALSSGPTGLEALAAIIAGAAAHLAAAGHLVLEHGAGQERAVAGLLVAQGFGHVRCHADLAGLPRVTEARRPAD
ncbi:MAG TPA: peptide chain release factor N(5)-glutamine methyltransferase [Steroidobacteraceae bacterium]|nr:peptide chain release factor N(5)-glutamine methyltransferase [Steroidobacteraceae bacterium]